MGAITARSAIRNLDTVLIAVVVLAEFAFGLNYRIIWEQPVYVSVIAVSCVFFSGIASVINGIVTLMSLNSFPAAMRAAGITFAVSAAFWLVVAPARILLRF